MRLLVPLAILACTVPSACVAVSSTTVEATAPVAPKPSASVDDLTRTSTADFATTETRLRTAIERRGLNLFTVVDHASGAGSVNLTLEPNKVFIFGNPKAGTQLMQINPSIGMELPLKAAIYEEDGETKVSVSDIRHITLRHGIIEPPQVIANIERVLLSILEEAAGTGG